MNNDFTRVVIRRDVVQKFLDLILVEFTILVGVVAFEDPLGVIRYLVPYLVREMWVYILILCLILCRDVWLGITLIVTLRIVICSVLSLIVPLRRVISSIISLIVIVQ